ncbi:MAG: PEP-CTERM sorting domain-containing protein [Pseudomonadota bacterium]
MKLSRTLLSTAAAVALSALSFSASAALTSTSPACNVSILNPSYTACGGSFAGNNSNQTTDVLAYISSTWGLTTTSLGQSDTAGTFGPFTSNEMGATGTLTFDTPQDGAFVLSLKAGDQFSLYYYNGVGAAITSISYTTLGVNTNVQGIGNGLSHATLYGSSVTPPVPEPETYALMLAGLGVVGFMANRRRKQV